ncbi:MAG: type II toxin-antitoxin system VapB family antitoxin [Caulobacter sp.]
MAISGMFPAAMTKVETIEIETQVADHVRELARLRGASFSEAIDAAVSETLARDRSRQARSPDVDLDEVARITARFRALPELAPMPADTDFYDADGLPR